MAEVIKFLDTNQRFFARTIFQNKALRSDGQVYENLFIEIMGYYNSNFTPVKPQGQFGDRKNDGFDRTNGTYYQVYAPENLSAKISSAITKLESDFSGLYSYWNEKNQIRSFYFVLNDKYKGSLPQLEQELNKIKNKNNLDIAAPFLVKDLEAVLFSLSNEIIFKVLGPIPSTKSLETISFNALTEVIDFLFSQPGKVTSKDILDAPDFSEKIKFNKLSEGPANLLTTGSYQVGEIDRFFQLNSGQAKENLKEIFKKLYKDSSEILPSSDNIFFDILEKANPADNRQTQSCVLVLMAYFFEACDIFESPES